MILIYYCNVNGFALSLCRNNLSEGGDIGQSSEKTQENYMVPCFDIIISLIHNRKCGVEIFYFHIKIMVIIRFHSKVYNIIRCYATILAKMLFYPHKRATYLNK